MMRRLVIPTALTCLSVLVLSTAAAAEEMRGLWIDAFHPGFKTPEQTTAMVAKAKDCNFNSLFVQVRKRGDLYYDSDIEPKAKDAAPAYDPLADVVSKAHAAGLEVHAWISVYEVYHDTKWTKSDPNQVHIKHAEWLMKHEQGGERFPGDKLYLDPGLTQVQDYLVGIINEIVTKYDVDGVHLDAAAYPSREGGYNDASIARFNEETNRTGKPDKDDEAWCGWRRAQVSRFMERAYGAATSAKPGLKVSAAAFSNRRNAYENRFQDWEGWLKAGTLDCVVPMVFPQDNKVFESTAAALVGSGNGRHVYIGQGGYKMGAGNSLKQVALAREAGFRGIIVYNYHYCSRPRPGDSSSLMDALRADPFAQPDAPAPMDWK